MGLYSEETLREIDEKKTKWLASADALILSYLRRKYGTEGAYEYSRHGLSRRIGALQHTLERTFSILPPDIRGFADKYARKDAEAFVQCFLVNVYGALDNIARIWCIETNVRSAKGDPIPDGMIGFGPKNTLVRKSLPENIRVYLEGCDSWFRYLESYRHAVAHRIPVYIPPSVLNDKEAAEFDRIESAIVQANKVGDFVRWSKLIDEQKTLGRFAPVIMHSFGESARPVALHAQMIADIATVVEIGEYVVNALPEPPA